MTTTPLSWDVVSVDKPDDVNVVIGQAHFIKSVEDLHEALGRPDRVTHPESDRVLRHRWPLPEKLTSRARGPATTLQRIPV